MKLKIAFRQYVVCVVTETPTVEVDRAYTETPTVEESQAPRRAGIAGPTAQGQGSPSPSPSIPSIGCGADVGISDAASRMRTILSHSHIALIQGAFFQVVGANSSASVSMLPLIPHNLQTVVVRIYHNTRAGMHAGVTRTWRVLRTRFAWRKMRVTVQAVIAACLACQQVRETLRQKGSPLLPLPGDGPWHTIGMDIFGPLPKAADGSRFILVIIDHFSKWPIATPLKSITASTIISQLLSVISDYGCPVKLLTDRGPQFMDTVLRGVCQKLGVEKVFTTAYYPQADGIAEAFMRVLKHNIAVMLQEQPHQWHRMLPQLLFAYRNTPHPSTGDTPFRLLLGYDAKWPADIALRELWESQVPRTVTHEVLVERLTALQNARNIAWRTMTMCYSRATTIGRENVRFEVGQLVWLRTSTYERSKADGD
eukprot:GHVS01077415.1.p1 GENE.GHVS01077415.1~~GHVS01077415.1.p1  ORF type:complete len:425 (-),score=6.63 GHVS01077415.1:381-1655(-)